MHCPKCGSDSGTIVECDNSSPLCSFSHLHIECNCGNHFIVSTLETEQEWEDRIKKLL